MKDLAKFLTSPAQADVRQTMRHSATFQATAGMPAFFQEKLAKLDRVLAERDGEATA